MTLDYPAAQHVMVLYTGGTIGMQASANGLAPASGFEARMREYLHSQPELVVPQWRFREMSPLIDSANMTPAYWQQLREAVVDAVDVQGCDSVLILHGTDTLAYSAAAMSFQLLGLHARVCFTGSMLPAGVTDSDAWENLSGALVAWAKAWRRACTCTSTASCWRRPVARKCAASAVIRSSAWNVRAAA
jgi:L-asparaginase